MSRTSFDEAQARLVRWCDSYETLPEILAMRRSMTTSDWWRLLGFHWTGCDNIAAYKLRLRALLLKANAKNLHDMMRAHERRAVSYLPPAVTVYRGCYAVNRDGLSWSLCPEVAARFPKLNRYRRAGDVPLLLTGTAERSRVVLKLHRKEREVICAAVQVTGEQPAV